MNRSIVLLHFIFICLLQSTLNAQGCCGIGSALVAGGVPALEQGTFLIQSGADYSRAENPSRYRAAGTINFAYGITERFTVSLKSNIAWLHSSIKQPAVVYNGNILFPETTIVFDNKGIGDGIIGTQFVIVPMEAINKYELKCGADIGIPWGPDKKIKDNVELPKNIQTGSGTFTIGGFLAYNKTFPLYYSAIAATAAGRLKFKNRRHEQPGNEANLLLSGIFGPFWKTRESISINYKATGVTIDANGTEPATRGNRLDLIPSIECTFTKHIKATCEAEIPLWGDRYQKKYGNIIGARAMVYFFIPIFSE
jgi:hypothetical protein